MSRTNFDVAALRSLLAGMELGSFARAADRVGRSTSAISAQIKKLEEQAGTALFRKSGRGLALTAAGEAMLGYARRLVDLERRSRGGGARRDLAGGIRLGLQEEFGEGLLPDVLGRFTRAHPKVRIEAVVARNAELLARIDAGRLDLALIWADGGLGLPESEHPGLRTGPARGGAHRRTAHVLGRLRDGADDLGAGRAAAPDRLRPPMPVPRRSHGCAGSRRHSMAPGVLEPEPRRAVGRRRCGPGADRAVLLRPARPTRAVPAGEAGLPRLPSLPLVMLRAAPTMPPEVERLADILLASVRGACRPVVVAMPARPAKHRAQQHANPERHADGAHRLLVRRTRSRTPGRAASCG